MLPCHAYGNSYFTSLSLGTQGRRIRQLNNEEQILKPFFIIKEIKGGWDLPHIQAYWKTIGLNLLIVISTDNGENTEMCAWKVHK